jgi:predicted transcriptional regulator
MESIKIERTPFTLRDKKLAPFESAREKDLPHPLKFKNRNRMEIVANLLTIGKTGALKTHLMYRANLSYVMISDYLDLLQEAGLIQEEISKEGARLFRTTQKGMKYLEVYESLENIAGIRKRKDVSQMTEIFA